MSNHPLLFELGPRRPTSRALADTVRQHGVSLALADADRRADAASYQEVTCRSALNRVEGMPFRWTLNPYRGCTHDCHYCYARRYHRQFELNTGDEFASVILVKRNVVRVLERELDRPSWTRETVAVGTATDPYQPIEGHYRLTRQSLEVCSRARTPVGIVTKGPMVVRDIDVLRMCSEAAGCTVYMSVPSVDERVWRALEPGTAHPLQRLRAVRELIDAGIHAGVLMAPIVPGWSSSRSGMERTLRAMADLDVPYAGAIPLRLQDGTKEYFLRVLADASPELVSRYERLYASGGNVPETYRRDLMDTLAQLRAEVGVRTLESRRAGTDEEPAAATDQAAFTWGAGEGRLATTVRNRRQS